MFFSKNLLFFTAVLFFCVSATLHAQDANTPPDFWLLNGAEATPENRLAAIQNAGRALLDFVIYQPEEADAFPENYRQKLIDAGFVFDFITKQQLAEKEQVFSAVHNSPVGQFACVVIPDGVAPPEEYQPEKCLSYAFLGKAPESLESADKKIVISLADRKKKEETFPQKQYDTFRSPPPPYIVIDQIGDDLGEAVRLISGWARAFPENLVAETGVQVLALRGCVTGISADSEYDDVFYVLANAKENARLIDGWFRLRHLSSGRTIAAYSTIDGGGGSIIANADLAFFMDPATSKIGEASVRNLRDSGTWNMEIRIQMKPGETLVVRIVRERIKSFEKLGYGDFECLPAWEYE